MTMSNPARHASPRPSHITPSPTTPNPQAPNTCQYNISQEVRPGPIHAHRGPGPGQRPKAGPGPGLRLPSTPGPSRRGPGAGPSPWALDWAQSSVSMNWPWSDLLTDVVLTSVGGLGVKGRGEGVVWVGEPLWASDSVKRKGVPEFLKVHFLGFPTSCSALRSSRIPESPLFEKKFCPRQRSCQGQVACSKKKSIF